MTTATDTAAIETTYCMCGCSRLNRPGRRFRQGHDSRLMKCLRKIEAGDLDGSAIPGQTVTDVRENPNLGVGRFTGDDILRLAAVRFGHVEASRRFMKQAEIEFNDCDLLQASEKAWGAAVRAVKAVAERRGLQHTKHRDLIRVVTQLARETGRPELRRNFHVAEALHANFYEDWMPESGVREGIADVKQFLADMEPLITSN